MPDETPLPLSHMTGLEQRLLDRLRQRRLEGERVICGFSGGGDSLALAAALVRLAMRRMCEPPSLLHVDHGLRAASGDEARRAAVIGAALGADVRVVRVDPGLLARHSGEGVEEAARRERYRALAVAAGQHGAAVVALAHHRDDQAESVLLHLLRGAGTAGAAGMSELSRRPVPWWAGEPAGAELTVWRPFLQEPRSVLRDFVAALALAPVDDPSNDERGYARNRVRLDILPAIERAFPGAAAALARHADLAAADDAALDEVARLACERATCPDGSLTGRQFLDQPLAIRRRVARMWLQATAPQAEPGMDRIEALLAALERNRGGAIVEIGGGARAVIERGAARMAGAPEGRENR